MPLGDAHYKLFLLILQTCNDLCQESNALSSEVLACGRNHSRLSGRLVCEDDFRSVVETEEDRSLRKARREAAEKDRRSSKRYERREKVAEFLRCGTRGTDTGLAVVEIKSKYKRRSIAKR